MEGGQSDSLSDCLRLMAKHIPNFQKTIQRKVLDMVSQVLLDHPFIHPGAPAAEQSVIKEKYKPGPNSVIKRLATKSDVTAVVIGV